jgi:hypothetical protein
MTSQKTLWLDWFIVALLILLPRIFNLNVFLTADEPLFMEQAQTTAAGIMDGNPAQTVGIGYPAVTVAFWVAPVVATSAPDLELYGAGRLAVGVLGAILLLLLFGFGRLLLGRWPALLGVGLLALDPYTLGYSRLLHIAAPLALFMTLAGICWLLWLRDRYPGWVMLTGLFSGWALLTKSTALLLLPMLAVVAVVWAIFAGTGRNEIWRRAMIGGVILTLVAALTFVVLWPAMWVAPLEALALTFGKLFTDQEAGTGNLGLFWFGRFVDDPGPGFYPVAFLLKSTPWLLAGLILNVVWLVVYWRQQKSLSGAKPAVSLALWGFALTYLLIMTIASKKSIRYMLPAFPVLYLLAGLAFAQTGNWLKERYQAFSRGRVWQMAVLAALLAGGVLLAAVYHPYYLTYYNPLLLGWRWAPQTLLVGWGEGLDGAARYIEVEAGEATVAAWYEWLFPLLYDGQTEAVVPPENMLTADRTVLYINQVQRDIPGPNIIHYFRTRREPEKSIRLNGIEYAWVYKGPVVGVSLPFTPEHLLGVKFADESRLFGYNLNQPARSGQSLTVTLLWQVLDPPAGERYVFLRLLDKQGQVWASSDSPVVMGLWPVERWQPETFIEDAHALVIPVGTPPGDYRLEVGMYDPTTNQPLPVDASRRGPGGGVIVGEIPVLWQPVTEIDIMPDTVVDTPMSDSVTLIGYSALPDGAKTGEKLAVEMLWQESLPWWWRFNPRLSDSSVIFTWKQDGEIKTEQREPLPLPSQEWGQGAIMRSRHELLVPPRLGSGEYQLQGAVDGSVSQLLAQITVTAPAHSYLTPEDAQSPLQPAALALVPSGRITLTGQMVEPPPVGGDTLPVTLYWQSDTILTTGYTVFVQLLAPDGSVMSQSDSIPGQGSRPTTGWVPGEVITDRHNLPLPDGVAAGEYQLIVGLYSPLNGQRLPLVNPAGEIVGDAITVAEVSIP